MSIQEANRSVKATPRPVFLIATQRSGTNYLRSILRGTGKIADFNEVMHSDIDEAKPGNATYFDWSKYSYFLWRARRFDLEPYLSIPSGKNMMTLFDDYLDFLSRESQNHPYFVLDVKYNSLHHFDPTWHSPTAPKFIFDLIQYRRCKVIHLVRRNFFDVFLSSKLAISTKQFVSPTGQDKESSRITLKIEEMFQELNRLSREVELIHDALRPVSAVLEIDYESISSKSNIIPENVRSRLNDFFSMTLEFNQPSPIQKIITNRWAIIENAEEVRQALAQSRFAWCID